ncbi:MAG: 2Fe-2S iron-sulfur cluster-binding protein [Chakrabartia sp.]
MIRVLFTSASGKETEALGSPGQSLLELGQAAGLPLEGTCEGQMACSTCHVIIDADWFNLLPRASEEEEDMIDLAAGATRHSRLACQIMLAAALDGLKVQIPAEAYNMQGR